MFKKLLGLCIFSMMIFNQSIYANTEIMPVSEIKSGMIGIAKTTTTDNKPTTFNVEILGVVPQGKGMPYKILAKAYGGIIPSTNGVIHGMSGSPVYINDKLIGAVARGIGNDVLPYKFYITPIQSMEEIKDYNDSMAKLNEIGVDLIKIPSLKEQKKAREKNLKDFKTNISLNLGKDVKDIFKEENQKSLEDTLKEIEEKNKQNKTTEKLDETEDKPKEEIDESTEDKAENKNKPKVVNEENKEDKNVTSDAPLKKEEENKETKIEAKKETTDNFKENKEIIKVLPININISTPLNLRDKNMYTPPAEITDEKVTSVDNSHVPKKELNIDEKVTEAIDILTLEDEETTENNSSSKIEIKEDDPREGDSQADEEETDGTTDKTATKQNTSKNIPIISPKIALDKLNSKEKNSFVVNINNLHKYNFQHKPKMQLFTKDGEKNSFISGFTKQGQSYFKKVFGIGNENFTNDFGIYDDRESDAIVDFPLKAGDPLGVTVAYGDFSVGATGTVTNVDKDDVLSFGHPMFFGGNVNYFMNKATVIDSAGGILDGIQIASIGPIIGRISQDRFSGVYGKLNSFPQSVPLRIKVTDLDNNRTINYGVKMAYDEKNLVPLTPSLIYGAISRTLDRELYGTAQIGFAIANNINPQGVFLRSNMYYDATDVGEMAVAEITDAMEALVLNKEKISNIYDVNVEVRITQNRKTATITSVTADKTEASPGEIVNFNIMLQPYREAEKIITIPYIIPKDEPKGNLTFEVKGGGFVRLADLMAKEDTLTLSKNAEEEEETTLDKLDRLSDNGKNNEIILNPIDNDLDGKSLDEAIDDAFKQSEAMSKLSPREREKLFKEKEVIYKTKYVIDNVRNISIKILGK